MNRATAEMRNLAKELIGYEASRYNFSEAGALDAFHVTDKLRPHLANLMGKGGFRALLSRALVLAKAEVSWLGAVRVQPDGTLDGAEELHSQLDPAEFLEGKVVLLAQLFGLLVAFLGLNVASRIVSEIWPGISFKDGKFVGSGGSGGKSEKAK